VASLRFDTRDDKSAPTSGVFLNAEFETSEGRNITGTVDPNLVCITQPCVPASLQDGRLTFQRAAIDARAYLRVTPAGRLALRIAGAGKVGGDDLPLHRRVSLGFPDPLPGYGFRQFSCCGENYLGNPALCDRAIVAQVELRTHLGFDFGPDWANDWGDENDDERWEPFHVSGPDIVVFADAGYAWSVGTGPNVFAADKIPSVSLWQPDVGIGLDLGPIGAYVAKSIGPVHHPVTFTVRMGRRF
jgi:outer membrane protein assembly factor BamA